MGLNPYKSHYNLIGGLWGLLGRCLILGSNSMDKGTSTGSKPYSLALSLSLSIYIYVAVQVIYEDMYVYVINIQSLYNTNSALLIMIWLPAVAGCPMMSCVTPGAVQD